MLGTGHSRNSKHGQQPIPCVGSAGLSCFKSQTQSHARHGSRECGDQAAVGKKKIKKKISRHCLCESDAKVHLQLDGDTKASSFDLSAI